MKKLFVIALTLISFNSFAGTQPFCLDTVNEMVTSVVELSTGRSAVPVYTTFEDYSGLHTKRYLSYATVGPGGMVETFQTEIFEFEDPSTECEVVSIKKLN